MVLNMYSVKIAAFFNNIGTVTEIIGLVVISIALYIAVIFGKGDHQSIGVIFDTGGTAAGHAWGYGGAFLASMLTSAWVLYGFHAAGGLAEETVNPTRSVPRAMIFAVGLTAIISAFWLFAMVLAIPDVAKTQAERTNAIAYIFDAHFPKWVTDLFLVAVLTAIFVCCLAVQVATTRLLFAYGRDKMIPASRFFGFVSQRTKTPLLSAAVRGGRDDRDPHLREPRRQRLRASRSPASPPGRLRGPTSSTRWWSLPPCWLARAATPRKGPTSTWAAGAGRSASSGSSTACS